MRRLVDAERLASFMRALGHQARKPARVYLTGGSSAVLIGWRASTIDVDAKIEPENDEILRAIPEIKERLSINVELASPGDFIPELPDWRDRSPSIVREGNLAFHHYDFYAQALAKIERRNAQDLPDVRSMYASNLITSDRLLQLFAAIEPQLFRYPSLDPRSFRRAVEETVRTFNRSAGDET